MNKEKLKNICQRLIPYLIIIALSILGTFLVFYTGVVKGHDYKFHVANVIEQYETLKATGQLSPISGILAMGFGNGTRLFYAPLPHLTVTLFTFIFQDILVSFKVVLVLSVILSGIFMYRLAMHFTNNNKIASLIASAIFILYPYRLVDAFVRFAFAETLAIAFIPLFFMGLYDISHVKDRSEYSKAFIEVILGAALLFLNHNLTALYSYVLGFIFLLCNIKYIIKSLKDYQYQIHALVAGILIISITSISLFSQIELLDTKIYAVSDDIRMLTDLNHVLERVNQWKAFSGFLSIDNISYWFKDVIDSNYLVWGIVLFVLGVLLAIILDLLLSTNKYTKHFSPLIGIAILFSVISIYGRRIEIYFGAIAFSLLYLFLRYGTYINIKEDNKKDHFYSNPLFYYTIGCIIVLFILLTQEWVWKIMPHIFLKIQFPWRLWGLLQFYFAILGGLIVYYFNFKKVASSLLCGAAALLLVVNNPLLDKRLCNLTKYDETWVSETDYGLLDMGGAIGFSKEYVPVTLLDNDYKPESSNSLWYDINPKIKYNFDHYEDYMYDPVILEQSGTGDVIVNKAFAPTFDMNVTITSDEALLQMPLIYYPGYKLTLINTLNNNVTYANGINVDGLLTFDLSKGNYKATSEFIGSKARRAGQVLTYSGITITGLSIIYALFFEKKVRAKLANKEKNQQAD